MLHLQRMKKSGEYDALRKKWEDPDRKGDQMGDYSYTGEKGLLRIVTNGLWTPMSFYQGEALTGEFIEIMNGFCASQGYIPRYETAVMSAELSGLAAGAYDVCADPVVASEERLASVNVTDTLMQDEYYLLVRREPVLKEVPRASLFIENMKRITILLSLAAGLAGTILGAGICFLRMRKNPYVSAFASLYIRVFRALPVVVLLLVLNYIVFRKSGLSSFWICAITFSIEFSAYSAEIFRSGIEAVPQGQSRAAMALGFGKMQTFLKVVLPQALIHFLPAYSGQFIATVKMTAVAGYISVVDLTKASDIIRSRTYEAFFPLFFTAAVYFLLCSFLVAFLRRLETKIHPRQRTVKKDILAALEAFHPDRIVNNRAGSSPGWYSSPLTCSPT